MTYRAADQGEAERRLSELIMGLTGEDELCIMKGKNNDLEVKLIKIRPEYKEQCYYVPSCIRRLNIRLEG